MLNLPDRASIEAALNQPLEPALHSLLVDTWRRAEAPDLLDLTHIIVIQPGDTEAEIVEAIGFSPLTSRLAGERGQPDWDWIEQHEGCWELIYTVGDSGFAFILVISNDPGVIPELLELCRRYGVRE